MDHRLPVAGRGAGGDPERDARADADRGGRRVNGFRRIRLFSAVTWAVGTVVVVALAFLTFPSMAINPRTGELLVGGEGGADDYAYPWNTADPAELEIVDGVVHGTRAGGYLRLPGGSPLVTFTAAGATDDDWVGVYQQRGTGLDPQADDWEWPGYLGALYPDTDVVVLPGTEDGLLWFGESPGDWSATVAYPEATPMTGTASGTGNALLLYEGESLSGRFQHTGTGIFLVGAVTVGDWNSLVNDVDEVDERASWDQSDRVVFQVVADTGDGSWTITLDTPAGTEPDPAPTP
ncbi:hypothetical protein [Microbacterium sp. NPDC058389]|uniref:hypothetical protein n=1 Tax=Microbacterium sp. NPDC058389 TaxID=3346475 RepID=UPI00364EEFC8